MSHELFKRAASSAEEITAEVNQTIFMSECAPMAGIFGAAGLVCGLIVAVVVYKCQSASADLKRRNASLERVIFNQMQELETQRDQLKGEVTEMEKRREENRRQLQRVDEEITEREKMFDKPEELLKEKENLLQDQWKLDETKRKKERQIMKIEKLLEPLEIQMTKISSKRVVKSYSD